jgi:hypothetical protein
MGSAGGDLTGPEGARLVVPSGALAAKTVLAITVATSGYPSLPTGTQTQGKVFAFTPHGQSFATPVTITVPFGAGGGVSSRLLSAQPNGVWVTVAGTSVVGSALQASVSHFSYFVDAAPGAGPIDGAWRLDKKVCNGTVVDMTNWPTTTFNISNTTGSIVNSMCNIPITLSYPTAGTVGWVIGQNACGGAGDQHSATYQVQGNTLTLTEALTPPNEYACNSGMQVGTLTKQ